MFQCLNGVRHCAILRGTKQGHFEMETTQLKKKKYLGLGHVYHLFTISTATLWVVY